MNFFNIQSLNADTVGRYILNNNYGLLNKTFFNEVDQLDQDLMVFGNGNLDIYKYFSRKESLIFLRTVKDQNILKKNIEQHLIGDVKLVWPYLVELTH